MRPSRPEGPDRAATGKRNVAQSWRAMAWAGAGSTRPPQSAREHTGGAWRPGRRGLRRRLRADLAASLRGPRGWPRCARRWCSSSTSTRTGSPPCPKVFRNQARRSAYSRPSTSSRLSSTCSATSTLREALAETDIGASATPRTRPIGLAGGRRGFADTRAFHIPPSSPSRQPDLRGGHVSMSTGGNFSLDTDSRPPREMSFTGTTPG